MKKITFLLLLGFLWSWCSFAQVAIGEPDGTTSSLPIVGLYNYSYSQQLVYASEINAAGDINSISFTYASGTTTYSTQWTIYLGHTSKQSFTSNTDWEPVSNLTQVYTGTVTYPAAGEVMTITFDTPFTYSNTDNLIIAVTELEPDYGGTISFAKGSTIAGSNRSIYFRSDTEIPDPNNPPTANDRFGYINYLTLGGIQQSCPNPSQLEVADITPSSANVSWTAAAGQDEWELLYGPTGFDPDTEGTTVTVNNTPEAAITGLNSNTAYEFYVTAICAVGDESGRTGPKNFRTTCEPATIPYFEGFENGYTHDTSLGVCWSQESLAGSGTWKVNSTNTSYNRIPRSGNYNVTLQYSNTDWMFIALDLEANTTYQLKFYARQDGSTSSAASVSASYGTDNSSVAMVNEIVPTTPLVNGDYQEMLGTFTPTSSGVYYLGILGTINGSPWYISLDDISVEDLAGCLTPSALAVTETGVNSATVEWSAGGSETSWNISWGPAGYTPGDGDEIGSETVTDTTFNITGLPTDTDYHVYVQAICGSDLSAWAGPVLAHTGYCIPTGSTNNADEIRNFNLADLNNDSANGEGENGYSNYANTVAPANLDAGETYTASLTSGTGSGNHGAAIWIDYDQNGVFDASEMVAFIPSTIGPNTTVDFPAFTVPAGTAQGIYRLRVQYHYNKAGNLLNPCVTTSVYSETEDYAVSVGGTATCPAPTNLEISNISDNSADVTWTVGDAETEWEIIYGTTGFDPLTEGTTVQVSGTPETILTGLSASSYYDVYVKAVCGVGNESSLVGPVNFATNCGVITAPYSEGFESGTASTTIVPNLACWSQEYVTGTENWKFVTSNGNSTVTPHSGSLMAEFRVASFGGQTTKLITPPFDLTGLNNAQLTFYYANAIWGTDIDELRVYYKHSASDTDWTLISGAEYTTAHLEWEKVELLLPESAGATDYVLAFEGKTSYARGVNLDDISIGEAASCMVPTDLVASSLTETTATLSWTAGGSETQWEVTYGEAGFDPETAGTTVTVNDNPTVDLTGLSSDTEYEFYVAAVCGAGELSDLAGPKAFRTTCGATTVPYVMDFETAVVPDLPPCTSQENVGTGNNWVTQVYDQNGMSGNVLRYGYHSTNPANAWFYTQGIEMQTGVTYEISYKFYGSSSWPEKMKVAYGTSLEATAMTEILADYPNINGAGNETVSFTVDADGVYYFGFNVYSDADQNYLYVDDIMIVEATTEDCEAPTDVTVTDITENGATVTWTASATATEGYEVNVYLEGVDPQTGTAEFTETVGAGVATVTVTGLMDDTSYDAYVTSLCAGDNSAMSDAVNFVTEQTVGIADHNLAKVNYYPNPVKDQLTITAAKTIENVTVYNLLGQAVYQVQPKSIEVTLDLSSLPTGSYVVKAGVLNAVSTFKVVKE